MVHPHLQLSREQIIEFCQRNRIRTLSLFGSATQENFRSDSDVDFLVEFQEEAEASLLDLARMRRELSTIVGNRSVDLVTTSVLRNPYRKRAILSGLERVYGT